MPENMEIIFIIVVLYTTFNEVRSQKSEQTAPIGRAEQAALKRAELKTKILLIVISEFLQSQHQKLIVDLPELTKNLHMLILLVPQLDRYS